MHRHPVAKYLSTGRTAIIQQTHRIITVYSLASYAACPASPSCKEAILIE